MLQISAHNACYGQLFSLFPRGDPLFKPLGRHGEHAQNTCLPHSGHNLTIIKGQIYEKSLKIPIVPGAVGVRPPVRPRPEGGPSPRLPTPVRQEFPGKMQRHSLPGGPPGTRKYRDHPDLPAENLDGAAGSV